MGMSAGALLLPRRLAAWAYRVKIANPVGTTKCRAGWPPPPPNVSPGMYLQSPHQHHSHSHPSPHAALEQSLLPHAMMASPESADGANAGVGTDAVGVDLSADGVGVGVGVGVGATVPPHMTSPGLRAGSPMPTTPPFLLGSPGSLVPIAAGLAVAGRCRRCRCCAISSGPDHAAASLPATTGRKDGAWWRTTQSVWRPFDAAGLGAAAAIFGKLQITVASVDAAAAANSSAGAAPAAAGLQQAQHQQQQQAQQQAQHQQQQQQALRGSRRSRRSSSSSSSSIIIISSSGAAPQQQDQHNHQHQRERRSSSSSNRSSSSSKRGRLNNGNRSDGGSGRVGSRTTGKNDHRAHRRRQLSQQQVVAVATPLSSSASEWRGPRQVMPHRSISARANPREAAEVTRKSKERASAPSKRW